MGLARLGIGQGKAIKAGTDYEHVLHLFLIGLQFSRHILLFKSTGCEKYLITGSQKLFTSELLPAGIRCASVWCKPYWKSSLVIRKSRKHRIQA